MHFSDPSISYYVGVGASAGGLEALQLFLQNLPDKTGACYFVVQHLSPDFKSMMKELLDKYTPMSLRIVQDGDRVRGDTIYLIPPKKNMVLSDDRLLLTNKPVGAGVNHPIDIFFRSLAENAADKAVGIILSGTGSDGANGSKRLKEVGALVIAQEPMSAKFDGMPVSAINTGTVDLVLKPDEIGAKLSYYFSRPIQNDASDPLKHPLTANDNTMAEIFSVLKLKSAVDFSLYKPSTVARRIERRMTIRKVNSLHDYLTVLFKDAHEVDILGKELLIGVSQFFRDSKAFDFIGSNVIPDLVARKDGETIRVWVAGCSTGEEAYSIAYLFREELLKQKSSKTVKIFATDVNKDSVVKAGEGIYSEEIMTDVGDKGDCLVSSKNGVLQINKDLRQMVIFANHNLTADPPFSNMDLVCCRNVLIYFKHATQKQVLTALHFSLRVNGYLFLGASESLSDLAMHFETIEERFKVFRKRTGGRLPVTTTPPISVSPGLSRHAIPPVSKLMKNYRGANYSESGLNLACDLLISRYAPPCILLDEDLNAFHVYGDVSDFVRKVPPGRISMNIKDMVNDDISVAVASAIQRSKQKGEEVCYTDVRTICDSKSLALNLRVSYVQEPSAESAPGYYWLIFERQDDAEQVPLVTGDSYNAVDQYRQRIEDLELELKRNRESLQVTVEELETTNEELQSANEELMSANEELQSTNEELQSVNEELYTVNSEYKDKIIELSQANDDLDQVIALSRIGILFLDEKLLIRRYTQLASEYVNLMITDVNRPLHHISQNVGYDNMLADVAHSFSSGETINRDIVQSDNRVMHISINPYTSSHSSHHKGVAITFSDVSDEKITERSMLAAFSIFNGEMEKLMALLPAELRPQVARVAVYSDSDEVRQKASAGLSLIDELQIKTDSISTMLESSSGELGDADVCLVEFKGDRYDVLDRIIQLRESGVAVLALLENHDNSEIALLLASGIGDVLFATDLENEDIEGKIRCAKLRSTL